MRLNLPKNYALADHWDIIEAMLEKYPTSKMLFDNYGVLFRQNQPMVVQTPV